MSQESAHESIANVSISLPLVDNNLIKEIRSDYLRINNERFGKVHGVGFYQDNDWRRVNYVFDKLLPADSILDVGVGNGQLLNILGKSEKYNKVVGIDLQECSKFISLTDNVQRREMSVCEMTFADNSFDVITCMEVLEHLELEQFLSALGELRRVAKSQLIMTVPYNEPLPLPSFHKLRFTDEDLKHYFPNANFHLLCKKKNKGVPWMLIIENLDHTDPQREQHDKSIVTLFPPQNNEVNRPSSSHCESKIENAISDSNLDSDELKRMRAHLSELKDKLQESELKQMEYLTQLNVVLNSPSYSLARLVSESVKSPWLFALFPLRLLKIFRKAVANKRRAAADAPLGKICNSPELLERALKEVAQGGQVNDLLLHVADLESLPSIPKNYLFRIAFDLVRKSDLGAALSLAQKALFYEPANYKLVQMLGNIASIEFERSNYSISLLYARAVLNPANVGQRAFYPFVLGNQILSDDLYAIRLDEKSAEDPAIDPCLWEASLNLQQTLNHSGVQGLVHLIRKASECKLLDEASGNLLAFLLLRTSHPNEAFHFGMKALDKVSNKKLAKILYDLSFAQGSITGAYRCASALSSINGELSLLNKSQGLLDLLENGCKLPALPPTSDLQLLSTCPRPLYVLHSSLPYQSSGYATRSHGILRALIEQNCSIEAVSRFGFPVDRSQLNIQEASKQDVVGGVKYNRLLTRSLGLGKRPLPTYLHNYSKALSQFVEEYKPTILHAASNFMNGLVVNHVGKHFGIPTIYELRGLWEVTRESRQPDWKSSEYYAMQHSLEVQASIEASAVVTITSALKNKMIASGVAEEKISVIPNGVDTARFVPLQRDLELESIHGFQERIVVGYIGSILDYEGLDLLLYAVQQLKIEGFDSFSVLIVGSGSVLDDLKSRAKELEIEQIVLFTGQVPHSEVERYYSLIDIAVYPRKSLPVCELVSPLKPLEAMAMQKAVVVSNVEPLAEMVEDSKTGLVHQKDDPIDLASKLSLLIKSSELQRRLGAQAREWVIEERDWKTLSGQFLSLYEALSCKHPAPPIQS